MRRRQARTLATAAVAIAVLAVLVQIFLPPILEGRIESRIEKDGGTAEVTLSAFPSPRLLFSHGRRIEIRAGGQRIDLAEDTNALGKLDGFDEVDIRLTDLRAGPVTARQFELSRGSGDSNYTVRMVARVRPRDLSQYAAEFLGGRLGGLLGGLAGAAIPFGDGEVPLELAAEVASEGGRPALVTGSGSVAGIGTGPLTEAILGAVLSRL